jgi:hypothetical protein
VPAGRGSAEAPRDAASATGWSSTPASSAACPPRGPGANFEQTDDELCYRIAVEYQPRPGWRSLFDRLVVRRAVERTLRETLANLERRFRERSPRGRLS